MTQFFNAKETIVTEAVDGLVALSAGRLARLDGYPHIRVVVRTERGNGIRYEWFQWMVSRGGTVVKDPENGDFTVTFNSPQNKATLDPFLPEKPEDVVRLKAIQQEIHEGFIDLVKGSRGARLKGPEKTLFSGEYWTGTRAVELGIADGVGDLRTTLRERFGEKVVTPLVSAARGWFGRVQPGVGAAGLDGLLRRADLAEEVISALEARALWARYGL